MEHAIFKDILNSQNKFKYRYFDLLRTFNKSQIKFWRNRIILLVENVCASMEQTRKRYINSYNKVKCHQKQIEELVNLYFMQLVTQFKLSEEHCQNIKSQRSISHI